MDWLNDLNWFAIQTKPHQEALAAVRLAKLDLEVFLPRIRQEQCVAGVPRMVSKPLFFGYFFARFCPLLSLESVRHAHGVLRVVGTNSTPVALSSEVIASIRDRVQPDGFIRFETKPFLVGENVTIEEGPFAGWMGKVEREWEDGKRVLILLDLIQQARLWIEPRYLTRGTELA